MDFIVNQMMKFQHINAANGYVIFKRFTSAPVIQNSFSVFVKPRKRHCPHNVFLACAVENRRCNVNASLFTLRQTVFVNVVAEKFKPRRRIFGIIGNLQAKFTDSHSQMRFKDLPNIHTRRHAQRIQHNINRRTVRQERHIFFTHNS